MKILINVPSLKFTAGVANFYKGLYNFWNETVRYNVVGRRKTIPISGLILLPWDIIKFSFLLLFFKPDIVMLNPSLGKNAVPRDAVFFRVALILKKRVVVLFHGWDIHYSVKLNKKKFVNLFNRASCLLVLASAFRKNLEEWGITIPVYIATTEVDDRLLSGFDIQERNGKIESLLFLARIEKEKGIYIAIVAFQLLKRKYPYLTMRVVGSGLALKEAKNLIEKEHITDIIFTGNLNGSDLKNQFIESDIYILPSYTEGMPTSVLEAMAFGLPVITRPVGGLVDFFENGKMGTMIESLDPIDFANSIERYINNPDLTKAVSLYNHTYAKEHFMASKVAEHLENICKGFANYDNQ
jgi:glycosyltransferase involved in cell wall biosynthesis